MIDSTILFTFVPTVIAVVISPGPDSIYTLTQSLSRGLKAGVASSLGTATGVVVHTTAAVLGLSALLRTTAEAYLVVKYVGTAYLVYLGVRLLKSEEQFEIRINQNDSSFTESYRNALGINVSNPQVAVFVLAFFPQFVPPSANAPLQLSILGFVYAGLSFLYLAGVALFAGRARHHLLDSTLTQRILQYLSGSVLIGFGVKLAVQKRTIS